MRSRKLIVYDERKWSLMLLRMRRSRLERLSRVMGWVEFARL